MSKGTRKLSVYMVVVLVSFTAFLFSLFVGTEKAISLFNALMTSISAISVTFFGANSLEHYQARKSIENNKQKL